MKYLPFVLKVLFWPVILGYLLASFLFALIVNERTEFFLDWLTAGGTVGAVIVALFGSTIKDLIYPVKVCIVDKSCLIQMGDHDKGISRLRLKNYGREVAENVSVYVDKVFDEIGGERKNFLPVPLSWTHDGKAQRDLLGGQYWHVDLSEVDISLNRYKAKLCLVAGRGVYQYEDLISGKTILHLAIYHNRGSKRYEVKLDWNPQKGDAYVSIKGFREI